jgi:LuxR family transcriptional regulator, positive regulator of biofilm formation
MATSETQKNMQASNEQAYYIVGPRRMQNELIASYLEQKTGNECHIVNDISQARTDHSKNQNRQKLLLWDCQGKKLNGLLAELAPYINGNRSENRIVLFNVSADLEFQKKFVLKGVCGFFYEHEPLDQFMKGVREVLCGKLWLSREMMTKCILESSDNDKSSKSISEELTERQIEILALIAVGATNDEIADKLCISPHTVKSHLYRIFKKINVPNRVQAALWAAKNI